MKFDSCRISIPRPVAILTSLLDYSRKKFDWVSKTLFKFFMYSIYFVGLGRGGRNRRRENLGIAKVGLTPPSLPQSWHSGGFDEKSA